MEAKSLSIWKNILYHLLPGAAVTCVFLALSSIIKDPQIPKALIFYIAALTIIPVMFCIMKLNSTTGKSIGAVGYLEKQAAWKTILFGLAAFLWAAFIMTTGKQVNNYLHIRMDEGLLHIIRLSYKSYPVPQIHFDFNLGSSPGNNVDNLAGR